MVSSGWEHVKRKMHPCDEISVMITNRAAFLCFYPISPQVFGTWLETHDDDDNDDQEVCPLENDNSTLIMVLGGETARENRENEHSTSIGNVFCETDL